MRRGVFKVALYASVSAVAAVGVAVTAGGASAAPDLIIQKSDSEMNFISCEENQPLVEGRIVLRNEGDSDANLRSVDDFFRSFIAVYVPENIDLIDKDTKRTKLQPLEQRTINVSVGKGKVKAGRNYNAFNISTVGSGYSDDALEDEDFAKEVQAFLKSRGYALSVDGDWGSGSKRALASFQRNLGLAGGGEWNEATAKQIAKLSGGTASVKYENIKDDQGRTKITVFAVVDPYNLIEESNEMNNVVAYEGYLQCD